MSNRKSNQFKSPIRTVKGIKVVKASDRNNGNHSSSDTVKDNVSPKSERKQLQEDQRALAEKWGINDKTSLKMVDSNISELARVFFN